MPQIFKGLLIVAGTCILALMIVNIAKDIRSMMLEYKETSDNEISKR